MNKLKTISLISVGLIILAIILLSIELTLMSSFMHLFWEIQDSYYIPIIILILLIAYFITLIKTESVSNWIKACQISNSIGATLLTIIFLISLVLFLNCPAYDECGLGFLIYIYFGFFVSGMFLIMGFILLIIGILIEKTKNKISTYSGGPK